MPVFKVWDASTNAWVAVGGGASIPVQDEAPIVPEDGDLWVDKDADSAAAGGGDSITYAATNPTITTNPESLEVVWVNTVSGEQFSCTDNTVDDNTWIGQLGSVVGDIDIYFNNVSLLMSMSGDNNGTSFVDLSTNLHTVTANGSAVTSTSAFLSSPSSLYPSGNCISIPDHASLQFGGGDWTIEMFVYQTSNTGTQSIFAKRESAAATSYLTVTLGSGVLRLYNGGSYYDTRTIPTNEWVHIAIVKTGSSTYIFINGVASTDLGDIVPNNSFVTAITTVGSITGGAEPLLGYIDDFRLTKGVARYLSDFTVPTSSFPNKG